MRIISGSRCGLSQRSRHVGATVVAARRRGRDSRASARRCPRRAPSDRHRRTRASHRRPRSGTSRSSTSGERESSVRTREAVEPDAAAGDARRQLAPRIAARRACRRRAAETRRSCASAAGAALRGSCAGTPARGASTRAASTFASPRSVLRPASRSDPNSTADSSASNVSAIVSSTSVKPRSRSTPRLHARCRARPHMRDSLCAELAASTARQRRASLPGDTREAHFDRDAIKPRRHGLRCALEIGIAVRRRRTARRAFASRMRPSSSLPASVASRSGSTDGGERETALRDEQRAAPFVRGRRVAERAAEQAGTAPWRRARGSRTRPAPRAARSPQ